MNATQKAVALVRAGAVRWRGFHGLVSDGMDTVFVATDGQVWRCEKCFPGGVPWGVMNCEHVQACAIVHQRDSAVFDPEIAVTVATVDAKRSAMDWYLGRCTEEEHLEALCKMQTTRRMLRIATERLKPGRDGTLATG